MRADCFEQDHLFMAFRISNELKDDAVFEIRSAAPGASQISLQLMRMKRRGKCTNGEQFQRIFDPILQIRFASHCSFKGSLEAGLQTRVFNLSDPSSDP